MAYTLLNSSGLTKGANLSWTHTFTQNNLCTAQEQNDSNNTPGTTDFQDSAGSPHSLTRDTPITGMPFGADGSSAANYSLVVPAGFTSPLKGPAVYEEWMAAEWSGNATSSVLDANASGGGTLAGGATSVTGVTINTGANAGLVLATASLHMNSAAAGITVGGTSFTDTYNTSHDGTDNNDSTSDAGTCNFRTASTASQSGLGDSWTFAAASGTAPSQANAISSYNVPAAGGTQYFPTLPMLGAD